MEIEIEIRCALRRYGVRLDAPYGAMGTRILRIMRILLIFFVALRPLDRIDLDLLSVDSL